MNIYWTETAIGHLAAIHDHIAQNSETYARRVVDRITRRTQQFAALPLLGHVVKEYDSEEIREVYEKPFRIIYRILPDRYPGRRPRGQAIAPRDVKADRSPPSEMALASPSAIPRGGGIKRVPLSRPSMPCRAPRDPQTIR